MADTTAGTYQSGPGSGRVLLKTGRAGMAARAGHDLTIEVTRWSARVTVPDEEGGGLTAATVSVELDLGSLAVREGTGGARPLTESDRRDIEATARKILGSGTAAFTSTRITRAPGGGSIQGTLTLNGKSQPAWVQVRAPSPGTYRGSATVKQTDFGITPYSGFFGALKLRDEVTLEFELDLTPTPDQP
ncbi:MAG: YceI family protein [Nocardiopsaceae bacterium]|nr:YceI family protein [Nocardiopsaceae bacterium]